MSIVIAETGLSEELGKLGFIFQSLGVPISFGNTQCKTNPFRVIACCQTCWGSSMINSSTVMLLSNSRMGRLFRQN